MIDYKDLFFRLPNSYAVVKPDYPKFTFIAANKPYLDSTGTSDIIGKGLFEVFPENPEAPVANVTSVEYLKEALKQSSENKVTSKISFSRYDIPDNKGGFTLKYWNTDIIPVLEVDGTVSHILIAIEDLTDLVDRGLSVDDTIMTKLVGITL